jgi:hypothetical protein
MPRPFSIGMIANLFLQGMVTCFKTSGGGDPQKLRVAAFLTGPQVERS